MKDQAHEQISALLDGELDTREHEFLLSRLERDHESQGRLDRYAVIGAAIRNELPAHEPIDISQAVAQAIESEPAPLMIGKQRGTDRGIGRAAKGWLKPVAGLAVAASVAVVTVMVVTPDPSDQSFATLASNQSQALPGVSQGVLPAATLVNSQRSERLNRYLLTHSERAVMTGMQGVMPYSRIAGFTGRDSKVTDTSDKSKTGWLDRRGEQ